MRFSLHAPMPGLLPALLTAIVILPIVTSGATAPFRAAALVQAPSPAVTAENETAILQTFESHVNEYVTLHRLLEGPLPPLQVSKDMNTVRAAMDALAKQIMAARPTARQGDLITPSVARVFRKRIAACLAPEEIHAVLAEGEPDEPARVPPRLSVNVVWPEGMPFNFVPPQLIAALPPLPPELQYRIIGRALVLWDHHANLIVDFLPAAFTT